jgi:hypothetical protein
MSAVPAVYFLTEFGADGEAAQPGGGEPQTPAGPSAAEVEEAFARGIQEGTAAIRAECDARLEEQRVQFVAELAAARQEWATDTGQQLAERALAAVAEFEMHVCDAMARILKPFISAKLHAQALAELRASLDALVSADPEIALSISGPDDILDVLRGQLEGKTMPVNYQSSADCDVRIVAGPTTLETRIGEWMAKLDEAVP